MTNPVAKDPLAGLRGLANRWTMRARDYAREGKLAETNDPTKSAYERGLAEGFYKAALELAETLRTLPEGITVGNSVAPRTGAAPTLTPNGLPSSAPQTTPLGKPVSTTPIAPPKPAYVTPQIGEVLDILAFAGLNARDVTATKEATYIAVFSKWENMQPHERVDKIQRADHRILVIESGKTKDTSDHFVEFAFQKT